jgi:nicotinamidase-related amidase
MSAAVLVIDIVNDTLKRDTPLSRAVREFLPKLNDFLDQARDRGHRVVFSTDSFLATDPLFEGRKKGWSIQGTEGAEVAREIVQRPGDRWLPKRRWSAFFKTDLDKTLREWEVKTVAVCGVTTQFCVMSTAMDAFAHDFRTVILSDLCASFSAEVHESALENQQGEESLHDWFRIMTSDEFIKMLDKQDQ